MDTMQYIPPRTEQPITDNKGDEMVAEKGALVLLEMLFKTAMGAVVAYFLYKFKRIEEKTEKMVDSDVVHKIVDRRMEVVNVRIGEMKEDQSEVKSDIKYIIDKLDRLADRL